MQYRIGDRDPVTGLYDVIWPDGSFTRNGIKIFNSAHEFDDVVLATERSDGMMILDGVKATVSSAPLTDRFGLGGFGEKPVGYLNGQVFNNEDEVILPTVSIEFAPGSPTELEPNAGDFVLRIKIDRPQRKDLRVKCELAGTAGSGDYTYTGLDGDLFAAIPAGELFFDVVVTPIENQSGSSQTVVVKVLQDREYRIGQNSSVIAAITAVVALLSFFIGILGDNTIYEDPGLPLVFRVSASDPLVVNTVINLNYQFMANGQDLIDDFTVTGASVSGDIITVNYPAFADYVDFSFSVKYSKTKTFASSFSLTLIGSSPNLPIFGNAITANVFRNKLRVFLLKYISTDPTNLIPNAGFEFYGSNTNWLSIPIGSSNINSPTQNIHVPTELEHIEQNDLGDLPGNYPLFEANYVDYFGVTGQSVGFRQIDFDRAAAVCSGIGKRYLLVVSAGFILNDPVSGINLTFIRDGRISAERTKRFPPVDDIADLIGRAPHPTIPVETNPYYRTDSFHRRIADYEPIFYGNSGSANQFRNYCFGTCFKIDTQNLLASTWIPISLDAANLGGFPNPYNSNIQTFADD